MMRNEVSSSVFDQIDESMYNIPPMAYGREVSKTKCHGDLAMLISPDDGQQNTKATGVGRGLEGR